MARPQKNNADYFPHDATMRDDRKVKALRTRHGLEGYAVWCIFLEILTDADNFTLPWDALNQELVAGDIGIETKKLLEIVGYMCDVQLIQHNPETQQLYTARHHERMKPMLDERERKREFKQAKAAKATEKTAAKEISDGENAQSKVKESKVKESKVNPSNEGEKNPPAQEGENSNQNAAPTLTFEQKTNADTPTQLANQMSAFYAAHPTEWQEGLLENAGGNGYPYEKLREVIQKFTAHRIEKGLGRQTYAVQNAALQKWVADQKNHENRPPPNGKPYTGKTPDYPITDHEAIRQQIKKLHPTAQFTTANIENLARAPNEASFHEWAANIAKKFHNGYRENRTSETQPLTQSLTHALTQ